MRKIEKTSNKSTLASNEDQINSRRKALKSMLAASGVVAGSQALSSEWTRPLVESVVLPAHAQTSITARTFDSGIVAASLGSIEPWYANSNLLDSLVSPAQAGGFYNKGVGDSVCTWETETPGVDGGSYQFMFRIDGSNVDVCVSSLGNTNNGSGAYDPQRCTQQGTTTINGQVIANIEILMDAIIDNAVDQEVVQLTNLSINSAQDQITGTLAVMAGPNNTSSGQQCSGGFTCDLTAAVYDCSAAGTCQDDGSLTD